MQRESFVLESQQWKDTEAATETILKISVLFFQEHPFLDFFQEALLCVHRTDTDFPGAPILAIEQVPIFPKHTFLATEQILIFQEHLFSYRTDNGFPGKLFSNINEQIGNFQ